MGKISGQYLLIFFSTVHSVRGTVNSWLVGSNPDRVILGLRPGQGRCVVFVGNIFYYHSASPHPGV